MIYFLNKCVITVNSNYISAMVITMVGVDEENDEEQIK
jgi:hypothetical protein